MTATSTSQRGKMVNAFNPDADVKLPARTRGLIERRATLLGPAYRLFYRTPVHIVRGLGTKLWDDSGDEYLDAWHDQRYFNTFAGNTVAVAAAQATFEVIRDQDLLGNAARVGREIRAGLRQLSEKHDRIGDIRGAGLYIGVEMVSDRGGKTPDAATAAAIVNGLRDRRVLISATGFHANVLKIRPPLVFSAADADRLLTALDDTLSSTGLTASEEPPT
jgi:4-aminobutyrate aminotransferase-like enzyme